MSNKIIVKNGSGAPGNGILSLAELGFDTTNKKVYIGHPDGNILLNPNQIKLSDLGITATAAELNKMDGVTATTTELNYIDGVTSNIQIQLNDKISKTNSGVQSIAGGLVVGGTSASATGKGRIMVTGNINPLVGIQAIDGNGSQLTPYYLQVADDKLYLGPTSTKAMSFDSEGSISMPLTLAVSGTISEGGKTLSSKYAKKSIPKNVSLNASGWSNFLQTVSVSGITENNNVAICPAQESYDAYHESGVRCSAQANGALTFQCKKIPEVELMVNVLIID